MIEVPTWVGIALHEPLPLLGSYDFNRTDRHADYPGDNERLWALNPSIKRSDHNAKFIMHESRSDTLPVS